MTFSVDLMRLAPRRSRKGEGWGGHRSDSGDACCRFLRLGWMGNDTTGQLPLGAVLRADWHSDADPPGGEPRRTPLPVLDQRGGIRVVRAGVVPVVAEAREATPRVIRPTCLTMR